MQDLTASELAEYLSTTDDNPLLLDVRQGWEFNICQLENSTLIPMATIPSKIDELDKERATVVICHHGIRSRKVAMYLESAGFKNIINLNGGVDQWAKTVDDSMAKY